MRIAMRLTALASIACALPLLVAANATASRGLGFEPGGTISAVSEGRLTFEEGSRSFGASCNATLNGGMATDVSKAGARTLHEGLIGAIEEGRLTGCVETLGSAATASLLIEPARRSELLYDSFLGTLPSITGVLVRALEVALTLTVLGVTCLYGGTTGFLLTFPAEASANRMRFLESLRLSLVSGSGLCPRAGGISGSMRLRAPQRITLLTGAIEPARLTPELREGGRGVALLRITAGFGLPTFIREVRDIPAEGRIGLSLEPRCTRWLWAGERCIITLTGLNSPASGEILVEYISGILGREFRQPYAGL